MEDPKGTSRFQRLLQSCRDLFLMRRQQQPTGPPETYAEGVKAGWRQAYVEWCMKAKNSVPRAGEHWDEYVAYYRTAADPIFGTS